MNPPNRPHINLEPKLNDFAEQPASVIKQALLDMYECAFRADQSQHTHLMEQASHAPQVLTDVVHELYYLRREVQVRAAADMDTELAKQSDLDDDDPIELTPEGEAALTEPLTEPLTDSGTDKDSLCRAAQTADNQRPLSAACRKAITDVCSRCGTAAPAANRQSSTVNRPSPRPPTIAELENDLSLMHRIIDEQRRQLEDIAHLTRITAHACKQLNKYDLLGILGLVHATVHRQPPRRQGAKTTEPEAQARANTLNPEP